MTRLRPAFFVLSTLLNLAALWLLAQSTFHPLPNFESMPEIAAIEALVVSPPPSPSPIQRLDSAAGPAAPPQRPLSTQANPEAPVVRAPLIVAREATPGVDAGRGRLGLYGALAELLHCKHADLLFEVSPAEVEACEARRVFARREQTAPLPLPGERLFAGARRDAKVQRFSKACEDDRSGLQCLD